MLVVIRGMETSFTYFGGVPRELLFDQVNQVIVRDGLEEGGRLIENRKFVRFSRHWRFRVCACLSRTLPTPALGWPLESAPAEP